MGLSVWDMRGAWGRIRGKAHVGGVKRAHEMAGSKHVVVRCKSNKMLEHTATARS
jgi:hypothetical protein